MVGRSQGANERLRMYSLGMVSGRLPVGAFESERRFEGADKSPYVGDVLSVWSAADHPNRRRGLWAFHRATNRRQRTRIAVAIDQNVTAIPWLVA